jgi:hypothetical protein
MSLQPWYGNSLAIYDVSPMPMIPAAGRNCLLKNSIFLRSAVGFKADSEAK